MTKEASALDRQIASAARVRVFDDGVTNDRPVSRSPVLELHRPGDLQHLRSALAVTAVTDWLCMCIGDAAFEFVDVNGGSLATIGLHHGTHIRWSFWDGDAQLSDGIGLLNWLADAGFTAPLDRHRQDLEQRAVAAAQAQAWSDAVPEPLSDLIPRMLATSQTGVVDSDLIRLASDRMATSFPETVERCQILLE